MARPWLSLAAAAVALAAATVWSHARDPGEPETLAEASAAAGTPGSVERDIRLFEWRVREDPASAADLAWLARLYLQRGRETGVHDDFRRAEEAARRSLALRTSRNASARLTLVSSLLAQHRFLEALTEAERLVAAEPEEPHHRALLGEIQLELGRYEDAGGTFAAIGGQRRNLAVAPRLARWAEIRGRTDEARALLLAARAEAVRRQDLPREQRAWFHLRVADLELRSGRLREAQAALEAGLTDAPGDARLLAAAARLESLRGRWRRTIAYGERSLAVAPDVATLALVGDAWAALGERARAESFYATAERAARATPEPYNRSWTSFRLDHRRDLAATRAILEQEIAARHDVYGWDQLAWARYLTGEPFAARAAMAEALRMGTRDAVLFFHAGMIERALGDRAVARAHLRRALELNPRFHPFWPDTARAALESPGE